MKKSLFENNSLTYREENGRLYPNLELPKQANYNIGKYGLLHLDFIKKHRKGRYTTILSECRLNEYLHKIDLESNEMIESIINRLAAERGIDEQGFRINIKAARLVFAAFAVCNCFRWTKNNLK